MKRFSAVFVAVFLFSGMFFQGLPAVWASHISESDIERFIRARIDMGESMRNFFKNRKPPQFGQNGGPSMEELRNLEAEINGHVAEILSKHGLTIEGYQGRSAEVFEDEGVQKFLDTHPDLKLRYDALPKSRRGAGGYGR